MSAENSSDLWTNRDTESPEGVPVQPAAKPDHTAPQIVPDSDERTASPEPLLTKEGTEDENSTTVVLNLSAVDQGKKEEIQKASEAENGYSKKEVLEEQANNVAVKETDQESDDSKEDEKKKKAGPKPAAIYKLFSFATCLDVVLLLIGSLAAMIHGVALPAFTLIFGDFINIFTSQQISISLTPLLPNYFPANRSVDCDGDLNPIFYGMTLLEVLPPQSMVMCNYTITSMSTLREIVSVCFASVNGDIRCVETDDYLNSVNNLVFIFLGIGVGIFLLASTQVSFFQAADERQVKKIRLAFYRSVLRQEIGWFDANPSGELATRIADDIDLIRDGIGDKLSLFVQWISTFFAGFIIAFTRDWRLTLFLLAFTPFLAVAAFLMGKVVSRYTSQEQKQYASAGAVAEEVLSSIRTVLAFGGEYKECERYNKNLIVARNLGVKKAAGTAASLAFVFFLLFTMYALAFWFGGFLISIGELDSGRLLTVFFAVLIGAFSIGQAGPKLQDLLTAAGAAGAIFEIIQRNSLIDPTSEEGEKPEKFEGTVEFKDICFSYPTRPDVQVTNGLNLTIEVGKTYALVGPSGCGKSTVIQLLQRFYDPDAGEICLGGKDIRSLNIKWLRQHIGIVSQEPVLFDTTIAENIKFGKEGATMEEVKKAAMNANAHDFITQLPDGYDTLVGERGTQLSGGQKQRVAIARALIRDPKILLLDEATSALDAESESIVQQALDRARAGRTTIIIAHRLSTIQNADVIASIENGRISEMGTHSELMDKGGLYYELVTAQSYGADEMFVHGVSSPKRLLSYRSSLRGRHHSGSVSESFSGFETQVSVLSTQRQGSFKKKQRQQSMEEKTKVLKTLDKKQEEWDKEIPAVSFGRIMKKNLPEWWLTTIAVVAALLSGAVFPSFAILFGQILKTFGSGPNGVFPEIHMWAGLFLALAVISGIANFCKIFFIGVSGENLTLRLRSESFQAILRQEIGWFDEERNSSGSLVARLADDASKIRGATGVRVGTLLESIFGMLVAIIIAFVYSWVLTLLILGVVPIILITGGLQGKFLAGYTAENKRSLENSGKIATESISNIRTVASFSLEKNFDEQYTINIEKPYKKALINAFVYGAAYAISQAIIYFMYGVVFRFGAYQTTLPTNHVAFAEFDRIIVVFFALVFGATGAGQATAFAPDYAKAKLSANRVFHLLDRTPVIDNYSTDGEELEKVTGEVATRSLHFNYPSRPDVEVLKGIDLLVKPGQTLALVGPSGCGKSTIVSLLERFYNATSGSLTLDNANIADLNIRWLRNQIGIVSQEPVLFDRSIAENICYGANFREVTQDEVIEAAKAANIHKFVESLPQGYNTNVGAKGAQISGGQKQRIAIARALIRDPKILLLDEATSALDTESEKIVQEALDKAREGRTSIVIAHRLSTIYNADCIVVISNGEIAENGTHKELMEKKGIYYKLNRFQVMEKEVES